MTPNSNLPPMSPMQPPQQVQPAALPLVALILCIVGFCVPPLFLVGVVLAIISLAKSSEPAYAARKTLAIVALAMSLAVVPVAGILAAIAIPNFMKFQARSKQAECKMNLKAAYVAQKAFQGEKETWGLSAEEIGFAPMPPTRYTYFVGGSVIEATAPDANPLQHKTGVLPDVPYTVNEERAVMGCIGNIDGDATLDVWSISTSDRTIAGQVVPAGQPHVHVDDTRE